MDVQKIVDFLKARGYDEKRAVTLYPDDVSALLILIAQAGFALATEREAKFYR